MLAERARLPPHPVRRSRVVRAADEAWPRMLVVDDQGAQRPIAELSRHARAELRVGDLPREKEINRRDEEPCVFDEKRPFLRKKNSEALINGELRIVRFHLAEIRVQRDVERQRIFSHEFSMEP